MPYRADMSRTHPAAHSRPAPRETRSRKNWEKAYDEIKHLILVMGIRPGENLSENALAARLGISRTPVREALKALEREGLVVSERGRKRAFVLTIRDVDEIFDLKIALEGKVARWAAERGSAADRDGARACRGPDGRPGPARAVAGRRAGRVAREVAGHRRGVPRPALPHGGEPAGGADDPGPEQPLAPAAPRHDRHRGKDRPGDGRARRDRPRGGRRERRRVREAHGRPPAPAPGDAARHHGGVPLPAR